MIRETGTDSPAPGPAFLVAQPGGGPRPSCVAARGEHPVKLDTASFSLMGRRGPFLFFEATDGQGAEDFFVLHAPDGRRVYADSYDPVGTTSLKAVAVADGVLRLAYTRAYYGSCSVLKDGSACWRKIATEGHFVRAIASQPPPVAACAAAYRASKAAVSDPSMITYDVDMTLTVDGRAVVLHRGAVGCHGGP